jgi:virginiamycin B lyase
MERLQRIDPASNKVNAEIEVGELPESLAVGFGSVWVSNHRGGTVSRVNPTTNEVVAEVAVSPPGPGGPHFLGPGGDSMWVGVPMRGEVVRIDPATNQPSGAVQIPGAGCHDLATDGVTLWLAGGCLDAVTPRTIWKVNPQLMRIETTIEPGGNVGAPVFWNGQLWMLTEFHLVSIDPKTDEVVEQKAIRGPGVAAVADDTLWVSSGSKLLRLRLE